MLDYFTNDELFKLLALLSYYDSNRILYSLLGDVKDEINHRADRNKEAYYYRFLSE